MIQRATHPGDAPWSARQIANILGQPAPTEEQTEVIEATVGPMLVVAGAGSGKTETMAARVVWLVANGFVAPHEILGLTFTRKAAGELSERIATRLATLRRVIGRDLPHGSGSTGSPHEPGAPTVRGDAADGDGAAASILDRPTVATYNAYAGGLVKNYGLRIGVDPQAVLLTEASQWQLATDVVEGWDQDIESELSPATMTAAVISLAGALNEHLVGPDDVRRFAADTTERLASLPLGAKKRTVPQAVRRLTQRLGDRGALMDLVQRYHDVKLAGGFLDFSDQVALAVRLVETSAEVAAAERAAYRVVLLDEYQDTSYAQTHLLCQLFGGGHPVIAVGDPHQAIYGWRGASASNLGHFPCQFAQADRSPAPVSNLSVSWRNDRTVLTAANRIASDLRYHSPVQLPVLQPRDGAAAGSVTAQWALTDEDEAQRIARFIAEHWRPAGERDGGEGRVTAAVLCRARAQFPVVEAALRDAGIPVEVVGIGGLLATPEVADVLALLTVVHDPARGDALMRLLTGPMLNLGLRDLHALAAWGRAHDRAAGGNIAGTEVVDESSLVDALDLLAAYHGGAPAARGLRPDRELSEEGRARLVRFGRRVARLRSAVGLGLLEYLEAAEQALGLDIEVALRRDGTRPRANLDALREVALGFMGGAAVTSLGGFLAWTQAAIARERGLDLPVTDPNPDAVQLITVHGAKGLEWDVVAIPGMIDGRFPKPGAVTVDNVMAQSWMSGERPAPGGHPTDEEGYSPHDKGWIEELGELPYPLRGDSVDLPAIELTDADDLTEIDHRLAEFFVTVGRHKLREERRLAYVAITRAKHHVLLSGSWWRGGTKGRAAVSPFVAELVSSDIAAVDPGSVSSERAGEANPLLAQPTRAYWPPTAADAGPDHSGAADAVHIAAAAAVSGELARRAAVRAGQASSAPQQRGDDRGLASAATGGQGDLRDDERLRDQDSPEYWRLIAELVLAERQRYREELRAPAPLDHVSATSFVAIAESPENFDLERRRPLPQQPTAAAAQGTTLHARIEAYFRNATLDDTIETGLPDDDHDASGSLAGRDNRAANRLSNAFESDLSAFDEPWEDDPAAELDDTPPSRLEKPDDDQHALWRRFLESPWSQRTPVAIEAALELVISDTPVRAKIDAVFTDPADPQRFVVVDWKTGRRPSDPAVSQRRATQLGIYRLAWAQANNLPLEAVDGVFVYLADGTEHRPERLPGEEELTALLARVVGERDPAG